MHIPERLIRLAKQRALAGFSALVEKTLTETDALLSKAAQLPATDQRGGNAARALLRSEGSKLRTRMSEHYAAYLDRAVETMHKDLRAGLHNIKADNLTLIDDDVVIRQMEVDRLVMRLRDADSISLGRMADATANQVRNGGRWNFSSRFRPLRPLELEPSFSLAWLEDGGQRTYHETAAQLLAVWHLAPGMNVRAILQRRSLDRRAEPGVVAVRDAGGADSLTWTWRRSAGTVLYVGASRGRQGEPTAQRSSEAFVKLQFDVGEMRALW